MAPSLEKVENIVPQLQLLVDTMATATEQVKNMCSGLDVSHQGVIDFVRMMSKIVASAALFIGLKII